MWTFEKSQGVESQGVESRRGESRVVRLLDFSTLDFSTLLLLTAFCLLPSAYGLAAGWLYKLQEVKPKVFVWVSDDVLDLDGDPQFERAGTAGFIVTSEGVVVVNTTNSPFHGRELLYEIRHHSELPVRYVINTSSSGEQMLGNEVFTELRATLIASAKTEAEILRYRQLLVDRIAEEEDNGKLQSRMRGFHVTPPTETFESEMTLRLGGQEIKLLTLLKNGSGDDAVVYLPAAKVLFLGELFQNGYFPRIDSRNVHDWIDTLRQVEKWDAEVYVPGHGEPGGKKELAEFRQFLEWFRKEVERRFQEGKSISQVKREVGPLLENYKWHAPELFPEEVEAVYKQVVKTPPKGAARQPTAQAPLPGQPSAQR
jgi:glyoxylase-like metal-dependent hydrolase (beta-lactamase superfamily II)